MQWLTSLDWGAIAFALVAIAFVLLVVKAVRRMRKKRAAAEEEPRRKRRPTRPARPKRRTVKDADEEDEDEDDGDEDRDEQKAEEPAPREPEPRKPTRETKKGRRAEPAEPVVEAKAPEPQVPAKPQRDSAVEREHLSRGLAKTRGGFIARLGGLFRSKPLLDDELLDQIEEVLFTADIGVRTSQQLIDGLRTALSKKQISGADQVWDFLRGRAKEILSVGAKSAVDFDRARPFVLLVIGVNGTGKTTTIGKLAASFKQEGRKVLLAAGDTFRAAAVQQLEVWGERSEIPVVKGKEGADPTSVIVDAVRRARDEKFDILIADTAGRLHTKVSLMEELQKVRRAVAKQLEGAPHETFLVLDSTTGQNAIAQATMFKEAMDISGVVLTKLDGTAKGGVVLGICNELALPVRYVGIGEKIQDLRVFDPHAFVEALFERSSTDSEGAA